MLSVNVNGDSQVIGLTGPWQLAENMLRLAPGNVRFLEFCVSTTETDQTVKGEQLIDRFANAGCYQVNFYLDLNYHG